MFCGNPKNHIPHSFGHKNGKSYWCDGVFHEHAPEQVEKYDPAVQAEDGTKYSKVTILIEDEQGVTIITAPRSSFPTAKVSAEGHIPLDKPSTNFYPDIDLLEFKYRPHKFGDQPAVTIERVVNNDDSK